MVLTGRINGPLLAILFGIAMIDSILGGHALWQSVVFGILSAGLVAVSIWGAVWSWREVV